MLNLYETVYTFTKKIVHKYSYYFFLDLMYGGPEQYNGTDRNLSITFNINHGVQIMRPPPYSNR